MKLRRSNDKIKKRQWKWLGQLFRMKKRRHPYVKWNPTGKVRIEKPREAWRRMTENRWWN